MSRTVVRSVSHLPFSLSSTVSLVLGTSSTPMSRFRLLIQFPSQCFRHSEFDSALEWKCRNVSVSILLSLHRWMVLDKRCSFMWIIGAIIAAAGMQVYIVWGTVRLLYSGLIPRSLNTIKGCPQERRREELSGIHFQEATVPHNLDLCCEWSPSWYASTPLSSSNTLTSPSLGCG